MPLTIETLQFSDLASLLVILCIVVLAGKTIARLMPESYEHGARCGYIAFLLYATLALLHFGFSDLSLVAAVLIRALVFAGIAVGASWCVLPLFLLARNKHRELRSRYAQRKAATERQRTDETNERLKRETEARETERREKQKTRIAQACLRCELLFNLYKPDIDARFTREMLDDFLRKYMHDHASAEIVERRADELCAIMERHREVVKGKSQPTTVADLARWFAEQQQLIEQSPAPGDLKENQLVMLSMRYEKLFEEIMRKAEP